MNSAVPDGFSTPFSHCRTSQLDACCPNTLLSPSYVQQGSWLFRSSPRFAALKYPCQSSRWKIRFGFQGNRLYELTCPPHASRASCMASRAVHVNNALELETSAWISVTATVWKANKYLNHFIILNIQRPYQLFEPIAIGSWPLNRIQICFSKCWYWNFQNTCRCHIWE